MPGASCLASSACWPSADRAPPPLLKLPAALDRQTTSPSSPWPEPSFPPSAEKTALIPLRHKTPVFPEMLTGFPRADFCQDAYNQRQQTAAISGRSAGGVGLGQAWLRLASRV